MLPVDKNPGVTVNAAGLLVTPFADAVICVMPGNKPIATPLLAPIAATLGALLAHASVTPLMTFPFWSLAVALNESVPLTAMDDCGDVTAIVVSVGLLPEPPQ
jgi:hypothetical protein